MNVFEFIKEKKADLKDNTEHYRIKLEPKFKSISNKINNRIRNTLNNPWISNFKSIDGSYFFGPRNSSNIPNPNIKIVHDKINNILGKEVFVGDWLIIDQDCINGFAELTGDNQWIHTDAKRAELESPFKTTIVHGFLTLSLIPKLTYNFNFNDLHPNVKMVVNYGLNQVRFPFPVKSGSTIRGRVKIISSIPFKNSIEVVNEVSVEVQGRKRYGCIAETVIRVYY
tara:strand:- start:744 stop:1421 length:678 start_codon:yes stop_codon:yes gene_type:complete